MKIVSNCLTCGSSSLHSTRALVAPFLAHRVWERESFPGTLEHCVNCGFSFFNPRLEQHEAERLYAGYRDPQYIRQRQRYEPWYTEGFNASIEAPEFLARRKEHIRSVLLHELRDGSPRKILDFGGARGEVVAGLIPEAQSYVYDISNVDVLPGVTACTDLKNCRTQDVDLIISSNVLEHVGDPSEHLAQVANACGDRTRLWIEVPCEKPFGAKLAFRRVVQAALVTILRPRSAGEMIRPGFTHLMHEHINYFTEEALRSLLRNAGWDVVSTGTYDIEAYGHTTGKMIWALTAARAGQKALPARAGT